MMFFIRVIVFVNMAISTCRSLVSDDWSLHMERVSYEMFPCKEPQPRVVYLREIIGNEAWESTYKEYMRKMRPYATILHRCEGSGCCKHYNERCQAASDESVLLTFYIGSNDEYKTFKATNHTSCVCKKISDESIKK
ncbi:uncharacterized protein LOC130897415 [Diorhabda carinulata]|uniref:uncharacterized protein LOC130897415 n=1 Tax=Diorhabda carinulata TaxID=1163345 RepID=UPI0025A0724C|nr:uncharacterized protein LOC130897415 [Diorhabda carinulata]